MELPQVTVAVPRRWMRRAATSTMPGTLLSARARERPPGGLSPELTLTALPLGPDADHQHPSVWAARSVAELMDHLDAAEVDDTDTLSAGGYDASYHRVSHRLPGAEGLDVLSEVWCWFVDGVGVRLICTCARVDYPTYCDLFEEVAGTVRIGRDAA